MAKALFVVDSPHEPQLPEMTLLTYQDPATGHRRGGWWIMGEAPKPNTVIVCVEAPEAQLELMAADPKYLYVGEVVEDG